MPRSDVVVCTNAEPMTGAVPEICRSSVKVEGTYGAGG
jgi:hypothetical protein